MKTKRMKEFQARIKANAENFRSQEDKSKMDQCYDFIESLANLLGNRYEMVPSCNNDLSRYLVPAGTKDQITYYGKPENSFRVSDHWNWYSSIKKCTDERYVQCFSMDMPGPRPRPAPGEGTNAIRGYQVSVQKNGRYHHVFGDKYDRRTRTWTWVESNPEDVVKELGLVF